MSGYYTRSSEVAAAIAFKEYLLHRDVDSRKAILAACIEDCGKHEDMKEIQSWFQNLASITELPETDRKQSIRADAYWADLFTVHSKNWRMVMLMCTYVK